MCTFSNHSLVFFYSLLERTIITHASFRNHPHSCILPNVTVLLKKRSLEGRSALALAVAHPAKEERGTFSQRVRVSAKARALVP